MMAAILIVEGRPVDRTFLATLLQADGHSVVEASDGDEALRLLALARPGLVISDVLMPTMDGYELVRRMRERHELDRTPVIFYTATDHEREARALARQCGAVDVLTRPGEPSAILATVNAALTSSATRTTALLGCRLLDRGRGRAAGSALAARHVESEAGERRMAAIVGIAHQIAAERDPLVLMKTVCAAAREVTLAQHATIGMLTYGAPVLQGVATSGLDNETVRHMASASIDTPAFRLVMTERRPLRIRNPQGRPEAVGLPATHPPTYSCLNVPIASPSHVYGCLGLLNKLGADGFSDRDEELALTLASQAGIAYENAYLYDDLRRHSITLEQEVADRKQAEEALRDREASFRALFAGNPLPMWAYDLESLRFLEVNDAAVRHYGYSRDEFLAMRVSDIRPVEDLPRFLATISELGNAWQEAGSWRHLVKSGRIIDVDITSHALTFSGRAARLVVAQDVSARKRTERALIESTRLVAFVADVGVALNSPGPLSDCLANCADTCVRCLDAASARIWILNADEGVLELQASAGLSTDPDGAHSRIRVGSSTIGLIAQERRPRITNAVVGDARVSDQAWAAREGMISFAGYPLIVDDHLVGVVAIFARVALSEDALQALASVARQIALGIARKHVEAELRTSVVRTNLALEAAQMGVWEMEFGSGRLAWSDTLAAVFGLTPAQSPKTIDGFFELVHPDDRPALKRGIERAVEDRQELIHEFRTVWSDGTVHWIAGRARVLNGAAGHPSHLLGVGIDIGQRKSLEEQFRQAQKMEAVGQLAGGVAHDFNNLLTIIRGYADLVLSTLNQRDRRRADVDEMIKAADRAANLTRQLLAFSRKQVLQLALLDVNSLVSDTTKMLRRLIGEDIELVTPLAPDVALVQADAGQLEQILMNLVINGRDAMPHGGRLSIETANVTLDDVYTKRHVAVRPGPYVMLAVTDSGIGMDEQTKHRIFEPFFTTKELGRGTGLGLATVYGIVEQSGGHIWVYSEPGRGTTFKVYLPHAGDAVAAGRPAGDSTTAPTGSETILLVEDEGAVRSLARALLERAGYRVLDAQDPEHAGDVFHHYADEITLLLTDVIMPGSTGPELFERLSSDQPSLRVLYMSGYTDDAVVHQAGLSSDVMFLQKPFTAHELARKVREALDQ